MNMMPEVRVMLALAVSSMLPIRMHFRAKMHTRRPRIPRTIPTIMRALTAWNIAAKTNSKSVPEGLKWDLSESGGFSKIASENRRIKEENLGQWALDPFCIIWDTSGSVAVWLNFPKSLMA